MISWPQTRACSRVDAPCQSPSVTNRVQPFWRARASTAYRWDAVVAAFATLFRTLAANPRAGHAPDAVAALDVYHPEAFPAPPP